MAEPSAQICIIGAIQRQIQFARLIVIVTGEAEICIDIAADLCSPSVRIVVVTGNNGAIALEHLANGAEVIASVIISSVSAKLSLWIGKHSDRIVRVAKFTSLVFQPYELSGRACMVTTFLNNRHTTV